QGLGETFTVRRLVQGEGVERVFPVQSPRVVKVEVEKRGKVRRAKLNYLRDRIGRATRIEERLSGRLQKDSNELEPAPIKKAKSGTKKRPKAAPAKEKAETTKE
ncbi:MAG: 50S ribosomal protein L19, partial [Planctomycetota bacterium]|nr:50S ribosomal protein L19 [Planctomycetota bacterium]